MPKKSTKKIVEIQQRQKQPHTKASFAIAIPVMGGQKKITEYQSLMLVARELMCYNKPDIFLTLSYQRFFYHYYYYYYFNTSTVVV